MAITTIITPHSLCAGLVGYWKLEEASILLNSFSSESMFIEGTVTTQYAAKSNLGVRFASTGTIQLPGTVYGGNYIYDKFTISFWMKIDTLASTLAHDSYICYFISTEGSGSAPIVIYLESTNDKLTFSTYTMLGVNDYTYSTAITDVVNFMNVIVSCAGVGQPLKIYINGVDDTQRADTLTSYLRVCNSEVRIGNSDTGQGGNFAGIIDEFCFWRRGLTATEIVQLSSGNANSFYPFI